MCMPNGLHCRPVNVDGAGWGIRIQFPRRAREPAIFQSVKNLFARPAVAVSQPAAVEGADVQALKSRGNELLAQGKLAEATEQYRHAIELTPLDAALHVNVGYGLLETGDLQGAKKSLLRARALDANSLDAHFLLGQVLARQDLPEEATQSFRRALAVKPDFEFAWLEIARIHEGLGDSAAAFDDYTRVLGLSPSSTEAADGKVRMLLLMQRWQDALAASSQQLELEANYWFEILKARALHGLKNYDGALALLDAVLEQHPGELQALHCKAGVLSDSRKFVEALGIYRQILVQRPDFVEALSNAGTVCDNLGWLDEAMQFHTQAATLQPHDAVVLRNLGTTMLSQGRYHELIALADRGLADHPDNADLHWHKAWASLLLGELRQGWAESEWRWLISTKGPNAQKPAFPQPQWRGQPIAGRSILLHWEQGLGDTLQMLRYVPLLVEKGARVTLLVQAPILPLCEDLKDICTLAPESDASGDFDYHCTLLSLPFAFDTSLESIPSRHPYLHSDPALRSAWEEKLAPRTGLRVGLVWSGSTDHLNDQKRSMSLQMLADGLPGHLQLVSLQKEVRPADHAVLANSGIFHAGDSLETFADTAALVDCMDVVISVDTSVAHLAGALGKPLWVLLAYRPDWRWMLEREDSPWYPTARLFRQQQDGRWESVIERVAGQLAPGHWPTA